MSKYELAEAGSRLPELVERAKKGEDVVLTTDGAPVAEVRPIAGWNRGRPPTVADIEWLRTHRVTPLRDVDGAAEISQMRDEDEH